MELFLHRVPTPTRDSELIQTSGLDDFSEHYNTAPYNLEFACQDHVSYCFLYHVDWRLLGRGHNTACADPLIAVSGGVPHG